jgi:hypothetical protein
MDAHPLTGLLFAERGHPDHADELQTFGRFVGSWDLRVRFFAEDGSTTFDGVGLWAFGWTLDGRAIQDVLHYGAASEFPRDAPHRQLGTSLRHLAPDGTWRVTWLGAVSGTSIHLRGGRHPNGDLVLEGDDVDGSRLRWSFTDITERSFTWTGQIQPMGRPWRIEQLMTARRRA